MESGCYRGFVKQIGCKLLASELNIETHKIIPWKVYTDADYKLRQTQKSSKRPCKKPGK